MSTTLSMTNTAVALLVLCAAAAAAGVDGHAVASSAASSCHNITGTCLPHGFVCANHEVVPFAKRCNGVEDCADGTDEFMCQHEDDTPMHTRTTEQRHALEQASCIKCTCLNNILSITSGSAWFNYAKAAPTDFVGLMTGTGLYRGRPCDPTCIFTIKMAFYKKSGVCRGWLCCARQRECTTCAAGGCAGRSITNRCYA